MGRRSRGLSEYYFSRVAVGFFSLMLYYCTYSSSRITLWVKLICSMMRVRSPVEYQPVNWSICKQFVRLPPPRGQLQLYRGTDSRPDRQYNIHFILIITYDHTTRCDGRQPDWSRAFTFNDFNYSIIIITTSLYWAVGHAGAIWR